MIYNNAPKSIKQLLNLIFPCISGYLIKNSYSKTKKDRLKIFFEYDDKTYKTKTISEEEYVELRNVVFGSLSVVTLIYNLQNNELYLIKKPNGFNHDISKIIKRETENYSHLNNPFIPKFYGIVKKKDYLVIEFVNGETLCNIKKFKFNNDEKIRIIYEIMLVINYLHLNKYIYRDLKPSNIMIDENKTVVLFDFRSNDKI